MYIDDNSINFIEISLKECGREVCIPNKEVVFSKKRYHLLHYVISGRGTFEIGNKVYNLHRGMLFYIPPESEAKYSPNKTDPWTYEWIGFDGTYINTLFEFLGINIQNPIIIDNHQMDLLTFFNKIFEEYKLSNKLNLICLGLGYEMFGRLVKNYKKMEKNHQVSESYVIFAKEFIDNNYQYDIKIDDIANSIGITPNYLTNLFNKTNNKSPKQYLIEKRMEKALVYLRTGQFKIKKISELVGYSNQLHFSNEFKKYYGISPKNMYKKGEKENEKKN